MNFESETSRVDCICGRICDFGYLTAIAFSENKYKQKTRTFMKLFQSQIRSGNRDNFKDDQPYFSIKHILWPIIRTVSPRRF